MPCSCGCTSSAPRSGVDTVATDCECGCSEPVSDRVGDLERLVEDLRERLNKLEGES